MDIEKTMEFILGVQARLEVSAQQHEERFAKLESSVAALTDLVGRLAQAEIRLVQRMEAGFQEITEIQARGEYKLNALIDTVDKLVRRDGRKE